MLKRCFFLVVCVSFLLGFAPIHAFGNPQCTNWFEVVRIRVANPETDEVVDFAAASHYVNGRFQSGDLHFTGGNLAGFLYNSPLIPLSGRPQDRSWLDANLISGHIAATVQVFNMQSGLWQIIEMRIHTHAPAESHPYALVNGEYIRNTQAVGGYVLVDGQIWADLDHADGLDVQAWNSSNCEPRS